MDTPGRRRILRIVLLAQLPAWLAAAALLLVQHLQARSHAREQLALHAHAVAVAFAELVDDAERQLRALSARLPLDANGLAALRREFAQLHEHDGVEAVVLSLPTGETVLDTRAAAGTELLPANAVRRTPSGTRVLGRAPAGAAIGFPVLAPDGSTLVLTAALRAPQRTVSALQLPQDAVAAILDDRGLLLARLQDPAGALPHGPLRSGRMLQFTDAHGVVFAAAQARLPAQPWSALAAVPRERLYAAAWRSSAVSLLPIALLLPLALWSSKRLAGRLVRRIDGLALRDAPHAAPLAPPVDRNGRQQQALLREASQRQATIARELHDGVGSSLAGVTLLLASARSFTRDPEATALIAKSQELVTAATRQIRQISRGMMPAGQEQGGLLPALENLAGDINALRGIACTVRSRGNFEHVAAETGGHLVRIAQEAISNALRHGKATRVRIVLAQAGERSRMTVADNGVGCDPDVLLAASGLGLRSMRERAAAIGAALEVLLPPSGGLSIRVTWSAAPPDLTPPRASPPAGRPA